MGLCWFSNGNHSNVEMCTYQNAADLIVSNWKLSAVPEALAKVCIGTSNSIWYFSMYLFQNQLDTNCRRDKLATKTVLCLKLKPLFIWIIQLKKLQIKHPQPKVPFLCLLCKNGSFREIFFNTRFFSNEIMIIESGPKKRDKCFAWLCQYKPKK